ncbi:MAG TPA: class I SAM-dependent methyltransferase [Blastocatellia bacterium]|nr:class I SAM-dependent methyltransferase [Blastocatellia bacterium]
MDEYLKTNLGLWNNWARINQKSAFYDVASFKAGESSLTSIEIEELGDVAGKSLLHLQCHFGMDTLSWARRGARVTGVDFSEEAIALARSLSKELGLDAQFICSDIYELPRSLSEEYDIVFTSYGVLSWLPDLARWGQTIARSLKPGGTFYIIEFHPVVLMLDDEEGKTIKYPYFATAEPLKFEESGSYADRDADFSHPCYQWMYSLSDVMTSLISAGLRIESFKEYPFSSHGCFSFLEKGEDGFWRMKEDRPALPIMFSIKAGTV